MTGGEISESLFIIIVLVVLWTLPWKGFALWRAAHRNDTWWFVVFLVVNTAGILEIAYLLFTRKKEYKNSGNISEPPTSI